MVAMQSQKLLSIVLPCYNEHELIEATHRRLSAALEPIDVDVEIIYVDDGSSDGTSDLLRGIQSEDDRVRVVFLARNFGHQMASTAGLDVAEGDAVVLIDADLQDPPEVIGEMVRLWRAGFDVVYGQRVKRSGETLFKLVTAKLYYRLINWLSETDIPVDTGDFRLMDRRVVDALKQMHEHDRFLRGMVSWLGFKQTALPYNREERSAGASKYSLEKMIRFASDGIFSFSLKPLRLATILGFLAVLLSICGLAAGLVLTWSIAAGAPAWTWIASSVLFLGGVQLICTGILGEYVGRIYRENKRRPLYLVHEHLPPVQQPARVAGQLHNAA